MFRENLSIDGTLADGAHYLIRKFTIYVKKLFEITIKKI